MGLRRFLGLINSYHSLIPNLAALEVPSTDLIQGAKKKDKRLIDWTPERLVNVTSLSFLKQGAPLVLAADASSTDLGGALEQVIDGGIIARTTENS